MRYSTRLWGPFRRHMKRNIEEYRCITRTRLLHRCDRINRGRRRGRLWPILWALFKPRDGALMQRRRRTRIRRRRIPRWRPQNRSAIRVVSRRTERNHCPWRVSFEATLASETANNRAGSTRDKRSLCNVLPREDKSHGDPLRDFCKRNEPAARTCDISPMFSMLYREQRFEKILNLKQKKCWVLIFAWEMRKIFNKDSTLFNQMFGTEVLKGCSSFF